MMKGRRMLLRRTLGAALTRGFPGNTRAPSHSLYWWSSELPYSASYTVAYGGSKVPTTVMSRRREADPMILEPNSYQCPEHHTDITKLVEGALDDDAPPVAYVSLLKKPATRPFQVIVTCPGANGTDAHQLTCTGAWTR
jgi:hypothetical protein